MIQTTKETTERIQRLNAEGSTKGNYWQHVPRIVRRLCSTCNGTGTVGARNDRYCAGCNGGGIVVD